jgi:N-acetylneuraminic acid mutarotase
MKTRKFVLYCLFIILILFHIWFGFSANGLASRTNQSAEKLEIKPCARMGHQMVYDSTNQKIILFGGSTGVAGEELGDTWSYDFATNTWAELRPITKPSQRFSPSMVYDSVSQKIILFGGAHGTAFLDDTWIYDCPNNQWTQVFPETKPPIRHSHAMIYDSENQKVILFGGYGAGDILLNDTWIYDYKNNNWAELTPSSFLLARYGHVMVYDPLNQKGTLFGGNSWSAGQLNDTWTYNLSSNSWTELNPTIHPSARKWSDMVYDSTNQKTILFGGTGGGIYFNDTWIYDSSTISWTKMVSSIAPSVRCLSDLAYDSENQKIILFGGKDSIGTLNDTWAYDPLNNTWTAMDLPPSSINSTASSTSANLLPYEVILLALGVMGTRIWYRRKNQHR